MELTPEQQAFADSLVEFCDRLTPRQREQVYEMLRSIEFPPPWATDAEKEHHYNEEMIKLDRQIREIFE